MGIIEGAPKMLTRETLPCWYELAFKGAHERAELVLRIHADYVAAVGGVPSHIPMVQQFKKDFRFDDFNGALGQDIGFEKVLKCLGTAKDGFLEYLVPTPLCRKITEKICDWCGGTGKDDDSEPCKLCEGGKNVVYDYREAFTVCASLSVFLTLMELPDVITTAIVPQLLTANAFVIHHRSVILLGGSYSRELVRYLKTRQNDSIWEMENAMRIVWERMDGKPIDDFYRRSFSACVQNEHGWLNINCPGDATGLDPTSHFQSGDLGYDFGCHNLDTPMQQLCLLAALGALNYTARRDRGER